jgi:hypothetical protein
MSSGFPSQSNTRTRKEARRRADFPGLTNHESRGDTAPMNRNLGILVVVLLLTASGIIAMLTRERNAAEARLAQTESARAKLAAEVETLRGERDSLRKKLQRQNEAAAESALAAVSGKPSPAPAPLAGVGAPVADGDKPKAPNPLAEMMKNPAMRDMMRQQQIAGIDLQYGKLFAQFHLTDEEKADFKQLLADRLLRESELGFKMLEQTTPEQRKALVQEYDDSKKAADARIRDFLNNESDYSAFKSWEETKGERMQLDMSRSLFTNAGEPLSPQQEEQLIGVMQQVRKQPSPVPDLSKPQNFDPEHLTQADIDKQLANYDAKAAAVADQAAQFLSPKQLETLRSMQQQWRAMSESGLKMTSAMFGAQGQAAGK